MNTHFTSLKRLALLSIVALMLLLGIGGLQAQDSVTINFVFWNYGPEAQPGWEAVVASFNEIHPEITVNLIPVEGTNWGSYLDGTATLIAGGEQPDLMWVATEGVQLLVNELQLAMPLDDYIAADAEELQPFFDDVAPALVDAFNVDGSQYMLPYSWNNMVMYYNTARFAEAGVDAPAADWTRDDFLATAQALTVDEDGDGNPEKYGYAWDNSGLFISIMPWVYANGGNILTDDLCAAQLTSPEVVDALQFMYDLIYTYKVAPSPTGYGDLYNLFQNGSVAMFGAGRWPLTAFIPAEYTDFDVQVWPGNPDQKVEFGIDGFPILNTSQNPDAAWEFLKFMTTSEIQNRLVGSVDSPLSNIPARASSADMMAEFPPANSGIFYGSVESGASALVPAPRRFNQMENALLRYTGLIFANEMSVEDALAAAQTELESIVTCG